MTIKMVKQLLAKGDIKNALKGASEHKDLLGRLNAGEVKRAYECWVHPEFYMQIGTDVNAQKQIGLGILYKYYGENKIRTAQSN